MTSGRRVADETLRTSITLPRDVAVELKSVAAQRGLPVGAVARELVILGLKRQALLEKIADAVA